MKTDFNAIKQYLLEFLAESEYSTLYAYDFADKPNWGEKPNNAIFMDGRWKPFTPDGLSIGNREIYAAIGIPELTAENTFGYYQGNGNYNYGINPSRFSILSGPKRMEEQCKILFNIYKTLDLYLAYRHQNKILEKLLAQADHKKLSRIEKTSINVSKLTDGILEITIIDFAPLLDTETDLPIICRYILIKNITQEIVENVDFGFAAINYGNSWSASYAPTKNESGMDLIILSDLTKKQKKTDSSPCMGLRGNFSHGFSINEVDAHDSNTFLRNAKKIAFEKPSTVGNLGFATFSQRLAFLKPNESQFIPLVIITGKNEIDLNRINEEVEGLNLIDLLKKTFENSIKRSNTVFIDSSDAKLNQIIDALQNLLYLHVGYDAIHTGAVYYDPNRAFVRDNYWITRALVKTGKIELHRLNTDFFYQVWKQVGILNSYDIYHKSGSVGTNELRIEIPAYFVLNVQQLWLWTNDDDILKQYYPMIKDALDVSLASSNHLFLISGDETWIWACYVNEMDYYLDSSFLMIAAMDFGIKIAKLLGKSLDEQKWSQQIKLWKNALNQKLLIIEEQRYANALDTAGYLDYSLVPTVVSHPVLLHGCELYSDNTMGINAPNLIKNALNLIWITMGQSRIIRSHTKTTSITGETPGAYLSAISDFNLPFKHEVFKKVLDFVSCTGGVFEIHDIFNPAWGTERRRAWDSAMILEGILQYLFGIIPEDRSIIFNPSPPYNTGFAYISDIQIKKQFYAVRSFNFENYELLSEDDSFDKPIQPFFHEFSEIDEDFLNGPIIIKEISVKNHIEEPYSNVIQTNASGKIRYYPESEVIEVGIQDLEEISPIIRIIPQNHVNTIKMVIEKQLITESCTLVMGERLKISIDLDEVQKIATIRIFNQNLEQLILQIDSEIKEITGLDYEISLQLNEGGIINDTMDDSDQYYPPNFLRDLDIFVNQNDTRCIILYDLSSKNHMIEVIRQIAIMKWEIYPYQEWNPNQNLWEQAPGTNIILITTQPIEIALSMKDLDMIDEFLGFQLWTHKEHPANGFIYIHNSGHVYQDTHIFCEQLGLYLKPTRDKAISMHPFGHYRLCDIIGEPANLPFQLDITIDNPINIYINGDLTRTSHYNAIYNPVIKQQSFIPVKPYCSFYSILNYTDFSLAAGGIATGQNCIRINLEADTDEPIEITVKMHLEQTYHVIHLAGTQRERILDTITEEKFPNGQKDLIIRLHPGIDMHPIQKATANESKKRVFPFTLGRYPRIRVNNPPN